MVAASRKILFLTELLPYPLVSGAKIRAYYVLRHLASHHQVRVMRHVVERLRASAQFDVIHADQIPTARYGLLAKTGQRYSRPGADWWSQSDHAQQSDSGGIREEAPSLGLLVLVLREVTERLEGVEARTAQVVGADLHRIVAEASRLPDDQAAYGRGYRLRPGMASKCPGFRVTRAK